MVKIIKKGVLPTQQKTFGGAQGKKINSKSGKVRKSIEDSKRKNQYKYRSKERAEKKQKRKIREENQFVDKTKKRVAEEDKVDDESVDVSDFDEEMAQVEAEMAAEDVEEAKF